MKYTEKRVALKIIALKSSFKVLLSITERLQKYNEELSASVMVFKARC